MSAPGSDLAITRLVTGFAATSALALAIAAPAVYFGAAYSREQARAHAQGQFVAAAVAEIVSRNPDFWHYEQARIVAGIARTQSPTWPMLHRVVKADGAPIAEHPVEVQAPSLEVRDPIYDVGRAIAEVRTTRSLRPVLVETGVVAAASAVLAFLAFLALRILPLRLLHRALQRAAHLANYDALTQLPNRVLFHARQSQAAAGEQSGSTIAVLCLDLDHFKDVNDTLGHAAGDRLLAQVAARLREAVRETDTVARLGGDEFAILQIGTAQPDAAEALAQRLCNVLAEPFDLDGHRAVIGTSIGIALQDGAAEDPARLLRDADLAMYQAKSEGRGTYCFFESGMKQRLLDRKRLEEDLREAIEAKYFCLHYQPLVEFRYGIGRTAMVGAEALIRWQHPSRGVVNPAEFIPLAETTGLIVPIGDWVLREACHHATRWPEGMRVAVNVSPVQFRHAGFIGTVLSALQDSGLAPERLEIEITEGVLLTDTEETLTILRQLRAFGVRLAMDDFGTGYSSLGYLRRFRFDKIKIDGSFVRHLGEDADAGTIVRAVVGIGRSMGIRVNAEGVESEEQVELLRSEGCNEMQGFLFGRPMPLEAFEAVLADSSVLLPAT